MRALLIEDNADFAEVIVRSIPAADCELVWAASRDSALDKLDKESFDLVILDRRIPSADQVLDDHQEHGWRVFLHVRDHLPGVSVWFLTGDEDADFAADINNDFGKMADIHGQQIEQQMYRVFWKRRISDCVHNIREFATERSIIARIAIRTEPNDLALSIEEKCALRIFARRRHGSSIDLTCLNGGLSRSRVLKTVIRDAGQRALITTVAKVGIIQSVEEEAHRFQTEISRLAAGGFPPLAEKVLAGSGNIGGLFYSMVGHSVESLFHRIAKAPDEAANIPAQLRAIQAAWHEGKTFQNIQISQIRRCLISDVTLRTIQPQLIGIDINLIESQVVRAAACVQHNDLHCANVVFDQRSQAMLIDFADAGQTYASIDPVTLELSTIFHADHSMLPPGWPTEQHISTWQIVDKYTTDCKFASFISACRAWALAEAGSQEEVIAAAYTYALRQLKYPDTDKDLARALIRACIQYFENKQRS